MSKIKVLLFDDDTLFGNIVTSFLMDKGFDVLYLNSLVAVATITSQFHPDIILMDVEIGTDDGITAIPKIRLVSHEIPIIILSSHVEGSDISRALKMGAINYLAKPINMETLPAYIERYVQVDKSLFISISDCKLNLDTRELFIHSELIKVLTHRELDLLRILVLYKNTVVTMQQLKESWSGGPIADEHTIYNYIRKIRDLLTTDSNLSLNTVSGGYMLSDVLRIT